ncbi:SGNH/GDSL hydrolase family protein [Janibacter alittae]|uniref:SGNH/GDSL hydrolase family protein n=1 Tax=Janibacter alittae TaxID=3115209 RepID=A0ABZ2MH80_9MICO
MTPGGQRSRGAEQGAAALERVGLVVVAAMIVAGVVAGISGAQLPTAVGNAVCRILDQGSCPPQDPTATPLEQATWGEYVALGDSYASGEGAGDYDPDTDYDHGDEWDWDNWGDDERNRCHRSDNAYSELIQREGTGITFQEGSTFSACSGATQGDLTDDNDSNDDEGPQLDDLGDDVSLITMSVGGNDLGFADVVKDCVMNGESGVPMLDSCQDTHADRIEGRLDTLHDELVDTYDEMQERAPDARVVIVGYPELFVQDPDDSVSNLLFAEDQAWMNEQAGALNDMLRSAAREAGVEFIDPTEAFRGHGIGSGDPWINDLNWGGPGLSLVDPGSFHPNAQGHDALADLVEEQIKEPEYP